MHRAAAWRQVWEAPIEEESLGDIWSCMGKGKRRGDSMLSGSGWVRVGVGVGVRVRPGVGVRCAGLKSGDL